MARLAVLGGKRLSGEIAVGGSKNAALPILFACLATKGVTRLDCVPDILDVSVTLRILECFGARIRVEGNSLIIDTRELIYNTIPASLTGALRASTYLIGACLARFHKAELSSYGGCSFGARPIDMHISAAEALGAVRDGCSLVAKSLSSGIITFDKISVGATVNALIMCSSTEGESKIYGYAREPHVFSLIDFLVKAGADIKVYCDHISVRGANLSGSYAKIIPDMIEAGTYIALSLATDSDITVIGAEPSELSSFFDFLEKHGVKIEQGKDHVRAYGALSGYSELTTGPYPEFPTDLQPQMAPLIALGCGGRITERVWHERFSYLTELSRFGVRYSKYDGGAEIYPSRLTSAVCTATDLRGGAALLIAALSAKGESVIESADLIKRGYQDISNKLSRLGARIKEIN